MVKRVLAALREAQARNGKRMRRIATTCAMLLVGMATAVALFLNAFAQTKTTYCGLNHEHTLACYSDPTADVETRATWEDALPDLDEGESRIVRLVRIARSQLGYRESAANYAVVGDGTTAHAIQGYTRYGAWAGNPYTDWNIIFVDFCLSYAGIDVQAFEATSDNAVTSQTDEDKGIGEPEITNVLVPSAGQSTADIWQRYLTSNGRFLPAGVGVPEPGDLLFAYPSGEDEATPEDSGASAHDVRMAIVTSVDANNNEVVVVEGDANGRVDELRRSLDDPYVLGYGTMPSELRDEYVVHEQREAVEAAIAEEAEVDEVSAEKPGVLPDVVAKADAEEPNNEAEPEVETLFSMSEAPMPAEELPAATQGEPIAAAPDEAVADKIEDGVEAKSEDVPEPAPKDEPAKTDVQVLSVESDGYLISADFDGWMREGYALVVRPLPVTNRRLAAVEDVLTEELASGITRQAHVSANNVALYDISVLDEDGNEVEPQAPVRISVAKLPDVGGDEQAHDDGDDARGESLPAVAEVVHLVEEGRRIVPETMDVDAGPDGFSFTTGSLSPFAFVFTVDFEYDGYTYNLEGGSSMLLSELASILGMDFAASDAIQVTFSDPSLLAVEPQRDGEGSLTDWRLVSKAPFATTEALRITLRTGEVITVAVTDSVHTTDLSKIITGASLSVDGVDIPWPVLVREGSYYDLRLEFKENAQYQFVDDETAMSYTLPRGIKIGDVDFERTFTMDVGDGVRLTNNLLQYNAELRTFFVVWNTTDAVGFNKLKASAVAQFRVDLKVQFDFNPDKIDFGNDVFGEVIRDTSVDVDLEKTGVYVPDEDRVDYEVRVVSRGAASGVVVRDVLYGKALSYVPAGGNSNGVSWESSLGAGSTAFVTKDASDEDVPVEARLVSCADEDVIDPRYAEHNASGQGFELVLGQMQDGEVVTIRYSASVDYDELSGSGNWEETFNLASAAVGGKVKTAEYSFEGEMRYVELRKLRDQVNWGSDTTTNVRWTVRVNENPKVSLAGTTITDTIYAGDVEALGYAGEGLHVRVYSAGGVLVGEYDVPWSHDEEANTTRYARQTPRVYQLEGMTDADIQAALGDARADKAQAEADLLEAYELGGEEGEERALEAAARIREAEHRIALYSGEGDPYQNESWSYTIPDEVVATNGSQTLTINNAINKYYYDISYVTLADKTKMNFDGYVGNEVTESRTGNLMQGGLFPPGVGAVPRVTKEVDTQHEWAPKGSNEDYIYWKITFQRQPYNLTRCVIEDDNPTLYGRREELDVGSKDAEEFGEIHDGSYRITGTDPAKGDGEPFDILWVEGLGPEEGWQIAGATNTRTTIRFYRSREDVKPGLLGSGSGGDDTITIYLRTKNDAEWINGTMTKYWPRDHTNSVTWIPNAHQVGASATTTLDIKKMEKVGKQVGSVKDPDTGVMLPVFRYEIYLTGLSASDFVDGRLEINDTFNTSFLQFVDVSNYNCAHPNSADLVSHKFVMDSADQQELGVGWWDQALKGYSQTNKWVGPVRVHAVDNGPGGRDGVKLVVQQGEFEDTSKNRSGFEPGTSDEYCMRYSLPYYLVVKDANAAQRLAQLEPGTYDEGDLAGITKTDDGKVFFGNEAEWGNTSLRSQVDADADFNPMSKTLVYDQETDTCTYTIVINPQRLSLNNGEMVCVRDTYTNLAVDFVTVASGIQTVPEERKDQVDWAYHNNVGTFWIPDETMVTITYTAKPIGDPGKSVTFNNTVSMLGFEPRAVLKTVKLNSESEGSAGDYNIRLFKFADNSMNVPLEGAVFQLFEENATGKVPVEYVGSLQEQESRYADDEEFADYGLLNRDQAIEATQELLTSPASIMVDDGSGTLAPLATNRDGSTSQAFPARESHRDGDYVYFCTTKYGYADIHLNKSKDGIALERGKQYYLKEIVTPTGYTKEDIWWSFIIDDMDYFDNESGVYVYRDGGVLTVSNSSEDSGIVLRKSVEGDAPSWDDQKGITFRIEVVERDTGAVVYGRTTTYEDFAKDNSHDPSDADSTPYRFKVAKESLGSLDPQKTYVITVVESDADVPTHTRTTTTKTQVGTGAQTHPQAGVVATVEATGHVLLDDAQAVKIWFQNTYVAKPVELTVSKVWGAKAQQKHGKSAEFELYRYGLKPGSDTEFETIPIKLSWNAQRGVYVPNEGETGTGTIVLDGTESDPWSTAVRDLPRYDHGGNAFVYSVTEKAATYADEAGGHARTVVGEDLDTCFSITARDENGELLPMSGTTAQANTYGKLGAEVSFTNEIATLIPVSVAKTWSDADANDHAGEELTFNLYRTTRTLPTGGVEGRMEYNVAPNSETNGITIMPGSETIELKEGDVVEVIVRSTTITEPARNKYKFRFSGLGYRFQKSEPSNSTDWGGPYAYRYEAIQWTNNGNDITSVYTPKISGNTRQYFDNNTYIDGPELHIFYLIDRLDNLYVGPNYLSNTIMVYNAGNNITNPSNFDECRAEVTLINHTQANENLERDKLLAESTRTAAQLVRSNVSLKEASGWEWSAQFPRDDGNGNEYTYFVLESPVAGYTDSYRVVVSTTEDEDDVDPRDHAITIANTKDPDPAEPTRLVLGKEVVFDPASSGDASAYDHTPFYVTVKNGNRYVVNTQTNPGEDPVWSLMTPSAYAAAGLVPYLAVTPEDGFVVEGLPEGQYVIEEFDDDGVHDADVEGYARETSYRSSQTVTLASGETRERTIRNTYTPIPPNGSFTFSKLWTSQADAGATSATSDSMPVEWPMDETIRVTLHRHLLNQDAGHTVAFANDDESFLVAYDIRRSYSVEEAGAVWSVSVADQENARLDGLKTPPTIVPPGDAGRFYNYVFTVRGVEEQVAREVGGVTNTYDCAYYVVEEPLEHYQTSYGGVAGAAPYITPGATYADEGGAIVNQFEEASITFAKEWYGQNREERLVHWPTRVIENDPESDEGANPDATTRTEPVPITLRLERRLLYSDGGHTVESQDFDTTYDVVFPNLTNRKTYIEIHPVEGKVALTMEEDDGSFRYTISRLQKYGAMIIDGEERHGEWVYYVFENNVEGYHATYYEPDYLLPGVFDVVVGHHLAMDGDQQAVAVKNDGIIRNTQLLGTMALQKKVEGVELAENKTFEFVVRRKSGAGTSLYLLEDGRLVGENAPHVLTLTVEAGRTSGWLNFQDVIPGEYEIRELGTIHEDGTYVDDGSAHMPGYDLVVSPTIGTLERDTQSGTDITVLSTSRSVTLHANSATQTTFTNTYKLRQKNVQFQKAWLPPVGSRDETTPVAWPAGESVTVELHRKLVVDPTDASQDVVDDGFVLVYEGSERDGSVTWTAAEGESVAAETDADQVVVSTTSVQDVQYIRFDNLTERVLEGVHAGEEWTYYLTERANPKSVYGVHYGRVEAGEALVVAGDAAAVETVVDADGEVVGSQHDSALINREDFASAQVTKVWRDSEQTAIDWPADASGTEVPITFIATGTEDGGVGSDERRFTLTSTAPKASDAYTVVADPETKEYTFTFYGLRLGYTYGFSEATLAGYTQSFRDVRGDEATSPVSAGGTIVNTAATTAKARITVTKRWTEDGHGNDQVVFRLYKAVKVTDPNKIALTARPEFFDSEGHEVVPAYSPGIWRIAAGNWNNFITEGGTSGYYEWMAITYNTEAGLKIVNKNLSRPFVQYRPVLDAGNTTLAQYNPSNPVLPAEDEYFDGSKDISAVIRYILPTDQPAAGSQRVTVAPRGAYESLPANAVPTEYTMTMTTRSSSSDPDQNAETSYTWRRSGANYTDFDAYDANGFPITYYVFEEKLTTNVDKRDVAVTYEQVGNDWTVTNTPEHTDASFTKQWYKADGSQGAWPQDSGGNDLPVTVQLTRRLAYEDGGQTKHSDDQGTSAFSLTYAVDSSGGTLTHVNGKTATAEAAAAYVMEANATGSDYAYTVSGLENVGTLAVGGVNHTGQWEYRFQEITAPDGYDAPAYYDTTNTNRETGAAAKAPSGGYVRNVQLPAKARLSVAKSFLYGESRWPSEGFAFTLAYDAAATEARAGQAAIAAPTPVGSQTLTITRETPSSRASFDEVAFTQPGTYLFSIAEAVPDDAVSDDGSTTWASVKGDPSHWDAHQWFAHNNIRYHHQPCVVTAQVVEEDGALAVASVTYDANESLTVQNTYAGKVGFSFAKAWLKPDAALPATEFAAWPTDETIDLVLRRSSNGVEDAGFAVAYANVGAQGTTVEPMLVTDGGTTTLAAVLDATTKQAYTLERTSTASHLYGFSLPANSLEGLDDAGNSYVYRMVEMHGAQAHGEYALKDDSGQVYATSRAYVADEGVIINRDNTTALTLTKVWQDVQGAQEATWPSGRSVDITLRWSAEGGASGSYVISGIGAGLSGEGSTTSESVEIDGATHAVSVSVANANPSAITMAGLPYADASGHKITYSVVEQPVAGYLAPTYNNLASQSSSSTEAYDGATITNRAKPADQSLPFEVTKRLVLSTDTSVEVAPALWPNEGFTFTLAYEGYKATDSPVESYDFDFAQSGYYDDTGYPILAMPTRETLTITRDTDSDDTDAGVDHKGAFGAARFYKAGTYYFKIVENETSDYYRRDEAPRRAKVTVSEVGGELVAGAPVYYDEQEDDLPSPVVTNQYKALADAGFAKVWLQGSDELPASIFQEWPSGKQVVVKLVRYVGNVQDSDFEVVYTIGKQDVEDGSSVAPTSVRPGAYNQSDDASEYALALTSSNNVYSFVTSEVLARKNEAGTDYQYFFTEPDAADGYLDPIYGTLSDGVVRRKRDAVDKVNSGGAIVNMQEQEEGGFELPSTGGVGTGGMYAVGTLLLVSACALHRRRNEAKRKLP